MKAYKVVLEYNGLLFSINGILNLEYKKGVKTEPKVGKLFVFKEKKHALAFEEWCNIRQVWSCEVPNLTKCDTVGNIIYADKDRLAAKEFLAAFWADQKSVLAAKAPEGTFITDWVVLEERVL